MLKYKEPLVTLQTIFSQNEMTVTQKIYPYVIWFFSICFIFGLAFGLGGGLIEYFIPEISKEYNNLVTGFSPNVLIILFAAFVSIKQFYKKNGRVFNKKEYTKFSRITIITSSLCSLLSYSFYYTYLVETYPYFYQNHVIAMLLTLFVLLFLYAIITLLLIHMAFISVYKKTQNKIQR